MQDGKVRIQVETDANKAANEFERLDKAIAKSAAESKFAKAALEAHNAEMKYLGTTSKAMKDRQYELNMAFNKTQMELKGARFEMEKFRKENGQVNQSSNTLSSTLLSTKNIIMGLAGSFAVIKMGELATDVLKTSAAFEQLNIQFEVLTGSSIGGQELVTQLTNLANVTPMTTKGLAENARVLLGMGESLENVIADLKMLGDVSGGSEVQMSRLVLQFAQIGSRGRVTGDNLRSLQELGFNPLNEIAKRTGETMAQVTERMSKGNVSFEEMRQAFIDVTSEGGRFYGMMEKQSKTLDGRLSANADKWNLVSKNIGDGFLPMAKQSVEWMIKLADKTERVTRSLRIMNGELGSLNVAELNSKIIMLNKETEKLNNLAGGQSLFQSKRDVSARKIEIQEELKATQARINAIKKEQQETSKVKTKSGFQNSTKEASEKVKASKAVQTEYDKEAKKMGVLSDQLLTMAMRGQTNTDAFKKGYQTLEQWTIKTKEAQDAIQVFLTPMDKFNNQITQAQKALQKQVYAPVINMEGYKAAKDNLIKLMQEQKKYNDLLDVSLTPLEQAKKDLSNIEDQISNLAFTAKKSGWTEEIKKQFSDLKTQYVNLNRDVESAQNALANAVGLSWKEIGKGIASDLSNAFTTPLREGENAFTRLGNVALNTLQRIVNKALEVDFTNLFTGSKDKGGTKQLFSGLLGTAGSFLGGIGGKIGALFNAHGNAFVNGHVQAFAKGGIVDQPTGFNYSGGLGIMGEAGTEAIVPLRRDSKGDMGVGAVAPVINVINNSNVPIEVVSRPNNQTDVIIGQVNAALQSKRTQQSFNYAQNRNQGIMAS